MSATRSWPGTRSGSSASTDSETSTSTVRLLDVPVDLYLAAARHQADLAREFALISFGERTGVSEHELPARLVELVDELRHKHGQAATGIRVQFEEAAARGERTIDLELPAGDTTAELTERLIQILDEADDYCRSGHLLTLASSPEVIAWRHWWRDQVVTQVRHGAEPTPFR